MDRQQCQTLTLSFIRHNKFTEGLNQIWLVAAVGTYQH